MSTQTVKGKPCVFCGAPGSPSGEHALPIGVVKKVTPNSEGPYAVIADGEPVGTSPHADRPKVPCCEAHNEILDKRFEGDLQRSVRSFWIAARSKPAASGLAIQASDADAFGEYFLKTMLLLFHDARIGWFQDHEDQRVKDGDGRMWRIQHAPDAYDWMVDESPPPDGFHLWISTDKPPKSEAYGNQWLLEFLHDPDGMVRHHSWCIGIAGLYISWVYHRGATLELPEPAPGFQMWPSLGRDIRWSDLTDPGASVQPLKSASLHGYEPFDDALLASRQYVVPQSLEDTAGASKLVIFG